MTVEKITVSLPSGQVAAIRRAVREGRAASVSAFVSGAVAVQEQRESLADVVAAWIREDGRPPAEAYAWADEVLGPPRPEPKRRMVHATIVRSDEPPVARVPTPERRARARP
jgi:Arc/MetJ-type ribon-helix-helix transcriptional regulator